LSLSCELSLLATNPFYSFSNANKIITTFSFALANKYLDNMSIISII